jgi:hypothetical protein
VPRRKITNQGPHHRDFIGTGRRIALSDLLRKSVEASL